jgi:hypothetical protein
MSLFDPLDTLIVPFERSFTLYRVAGLLRAEAQGLTIEYQAVENILGLGRSRARSLFVPYRDLVTLRLLPHRLRSAELLIQTRNLQALRKLPGSLQGRYICRIRRHDLPQAELLVSQLELGLSQERIDRLENPDAVRPPLLEEPLGRLLLKEAIQRLRDFLR